MFRYTNLGYKWLDHGTRHSGTWFLWISEDRKSAETVGVEARVDGGNPCDVFLEQACSTCQTQASAHIAPSAWTDL